MIKILFICHGNICRSTMAEFVFRDMVRKAGLSDKIECASAATSTEEIGNPVHPGTRRVLKGLGIDCSEKRARQMRHADYDAYDYLIGMDSANIRNMERITGGDPEGKISFLLEHASKEYARYGREVADPWYTGDFETTYRDVKAGCEGLLEALQKKIGNEKA